MVGDVIAFAGMNHHVTTEQSDETWRLFAFDHRNLTSRPDYINITAT